MDKSLAKISKYLSFILRHNPQSIGLELDEQGWASLDELIEKSQQELSRAQIFEVVKTNDKQRFALSDDKMKIRANQGHSIEISLGLAPQVPPQFLYHGTARKSAEVILREGLKPMGRQHVHLSIDRVTATRVGSRHGKPYLIRIPARKMFGQGQNFYCSENGVWLTDQVSPEFLEPIG